MKKVLLATFVLLSFSTAIAGEGDLSRAKGLGAYTGEAPKKPADEVPAELSGVGITENIGGAVDLSLMVTDEKGNKVPLSSFFHPHKPVIFSPIYFSCPGLCNFHLNGLTETLKQVDWSPGQKFEIVALSFDAKETPDLAEKKKASYLKSYERPGTEGGWHFVTADEQTIKKITESVGFKFKWNEDDKQWAHASAAIMLSPEGKIARYLHGIVFEPRDVKLALNEAADGKVGGVVDSAMLFCFKYDSHQSKYGLQVFKLMKLAGAVTVLALALWLGTTMIQAKREKT